MKKSKLNNMKQKLIIMTVAILSCSVLLSFSNPLSELFAYSFVSVDPATGKIKAKLAPTVAVKQKPKGKTTAVTYSLEGAKSSVRLTPGDNIFDVMSDMQTSSLNPILYIGLHKVTSGKNGRTLVIDPNSGDNVLGFNISPIDGSNWRIVVGAALFSGEYAFVDKTTSSSEGNLIVWTFGVD